MSVPDVYECGSYDPVITLKQLWGSPGTELSTCGGPLAVFAVHKSYTTLTLRLAAPA